uniref:Uncharacterized protein n=1 Tax=Arundo donax TaxID=35708 RepID=A0A0A9FSE3_ARUDO
MDPLRFLWELTWPHPIRPCLAFQPRGVREKQRNGISLQDKVPWA